jgi:hypothetical protein
MNSRITRMNGGMTLPNARIAHENVLTARANIRIMLEERPDHVWERADHVGDIRITRADVRDHPRNVRITRRDDRIAGWDRWKRRAEQVRGGNDDQRRAAEQAEKRFTTEDTEDTAPRRITPSLPALRAQR